MDLNVFSSIESQCLTFVGHVKLQANPSIHPDTPILVLKSIFQRYDADHDRYLNDLANWQCIVYDLCIGEESEEYINMMIMVMRMIRMRSNENKVKGAKKRSKNEKEKEKKAKHDEPLPIVTDLKNTCASRLADIIMILPSFGQKARG
eukprot:504751_1